MLHWSQFVPNMSTDIREHEALLHHHHLPLVQSPGEIKRREVVLDPQVSPEEIKNREVDLGLRVGLLSLQLFPNGGATDIVFVTLFCIAVGTAIAWCGGRCAMADGHCLN